MEIDQSGKIEHTSRTTVIACANSEEASVRISAGEKQKLIRAMKAHDHPRKIFVFKIFAGLIFLLMRDSRALFIVIDREYLSREGIIKDILAGLYRKYDIPAPRIRFDLIGKKSSAHRAALETFQKKRKPTKTIKAKDVLRLFYGR